MPGHGIASKHSKPSKRIYWEWRSTVYLCERWDMTITTIPRKGNVTNGVPPSSLCPCHDRLRRMGQYHKPSQLPPARSRQVSVPPKLRQSPTFHNLGRLNHIQGSSSQSLVRLFLKSRLPIRKPGYPV